MRRWRRYILLLLFSANAAFSLGQTWADGYYITPANDSVCTKIKLPIPLFEGFNPQGLQHKIKTKVADSSRLEIFRAGDVREFGFVYKNYQWKYVAILANDRTWSFYQTIYSGNHIAGYFAYSIGYKGSSNVWVRRQTDSGETVFLKSASMSKRKIRRKLIAIYTGDADAIAVIEHSRLVLRNLAWSVKNLLQKIADSNSSASKIGYQAPPPFSYTRLSAAPLP